MRETHNFVGDRNSFGEPFKVFLSFLPESLKLSSKVPPSIVETTKSKEDSRQLLVVIKFSFVQSKENRNLTLLLLKQCNDTLFLPQRVAGSSETQKRG